MKNKILLTLCACLGTASISSASPITIRLFNHTDIHADNIQLYSLAGALDAVYGPTDTPMPMQETVTLSDLNFNSSLGAHEFTLNSATSLNMFIGLDAPTISSGNSTPSYTGGTAVPWWDANFGQNFEVTYNNNIHDVADVTSINAVGVPMRIRTQSGETYSGWQGFQDPTRQLALQTSLANHAPWSAWPQQTSQGTVRYVGANTAPVGSLNIPNQLGGTSATVPSFSAYIDHVRENDISVNLAVPETRGTSVSDVVFWWDFEVHVDQDGNLQTRLDENGLAQGTVHAKNTVTNDEWTWTGLTAYIQADVNDTDDAFFSSYIYQAPASEPYLGDQIVFSNAGSGADQWSDLATDTGIDAVWINRNVQDRMLMDIAFGMAYGFVGSETAYLDPGQHATWGEAPSWLWYEDSNTGIAFDDLQSESYYSEWSYRIWQEYQALYTHPISDRFEFDGLRPVVSVFGIDALEIHFYNFMDPIPEPGVMAFLLLAGSVLLGRRRR